MNNTIWVLIGAIAAALPMVFVTIYRDTKNIYWIIFAILSYSILVLIYVVLLYRLNNGLIIYSLIKFLSIIIIAIYGIIVLKNKLTANIIFGLFFGFISIYLLSTSI
jgi:hypothetical protein